MMINLRGQRRINSRFVKFEGHKIITTEDGKRRIHRWIEDIDGTHHDLDWDGVTDPDPTTVIPNTRPMNVVELFLQDDDTITEYKRPIIAWRLEPGGFPQPIYAGGHIPDGYLGRQSEECIVVIELPNGEYQKTGFEEPSFDTLDDAKESLRLQAKAVKTTA